MSNDSNGNMIHINKTTAALLVTIIIFMLGQGILALIWGAGLSTTVRNMSESIAELKQNVASGTQYRYTSADAANDKAMTLRLLDAIHERIEQTDIRIKRIEDMHINGGTK